MYRYENIRKVLSFVPGALLEEENEATLIKNALQFYNQNIRIRTITDDILFAVCQVENHKATLPTGFKNIVDISFSDVLPDDTISDSNTIFLQPDANGITTTIFARTYWQFFKERSYCMTYVGKNSSLILNGCLEYLCNDGINFSIDSSLQTITLDIEEGYIFLLFNSTMTDSENNYLVPDHPVLWRALALGIEAKHWQDRAFRKEENANNMFIERTQMANLSVSEFLKIHLLSSFNDDDYRLKMHTVRQLPQISAQRDFYNFKR